MLINLTAESPNTRYHLLTQTLIPRPIAWVLSENSDQSLNLAPFSFFNAVCSDPALMMLSIGKKDQEQPKDTRVNLLSGREFVIHIAALDQAEVLNKSAATLAYGESEVLANDLVLVKFPQSPLPRLAVAPIAYHCCLYEYHELGANAQAIVYAEVLQLYVDDAIVQVNNGRYIVSAAQLNPLCRLGAGEYGALGKVFTLNRPE